MQKHIPTMGSASNTSEFRMTTWNGKYHHALIVLMFKMLNFQPGFVGGSFWISYQNGHVFKLSTEVVVFIGCKRRLERMVIIQGRHTQKRQALLNWGHFITYKQASSVSIIWDVHLSFLIPHKSERMKNLIVSNAGW